MDKKTKISYLMMMSKKRTILESIKVSAVEYSIVFAFLSDMESGKVPVPFFGTIECKTK